MLNVITPSLPSSSKDERGLDLDEDVQLRSVNLSATLQKLYLWEKKLYEEVKVYQIVFAQSCEIVYNFLWILIVATVFIATTASTDLIWYIFLHV